MEEEVEAPAKADVRPEEPFRLGFRPALDGIRGMGILMVFVYHAITFLLPRDTHDVLKGFFVCIDIFFVLSGFLITTLLLQEQRSRGSISLRAFYARRALRLLPALVVLLIGMAVYVVVMDLSKRTFLKTVFSVATYSTNWLIADGQRLTEGFGHTWSLAVEEQFYLVWPATLVGLMWLTRRRPRAVLYIVLGIIAAGAIWRAIMWDRYELWTKVYFRTDARIDQLLIGVALAIAIHQGLLRSRSRPFVAGLAMAFFAVFSVTVDHFHGSYFQVWAVITPLMAAVLIFATLEPGGPVQMFLGSSFMRFFGRISYSLYLWHVPVDHAFLIHFKDMPLVPKVVLSQSIGLGLAVASHYCVERPFLQLKDRFSQRHTPEPSPEGVAVLPAS